MLARYMAAALTIFHTSPVHVPRFEALRSEMASDIPVRHVVNEALLGTAMGEEGAPVKLRGLMETEMSALAAVSRVILCTCSTVGGVAESFDGLHGARVLRVDRPMAATAVSLGRRISVVASIASTLEPTRELLREEAVRAGRPVDIAVSVVEGAWALFEAGQIDEYLRLIARHLERASSEAEVVVLAQASMAGVERLVGVPIPVLSSPALGLATAVDLLGG